jgi:hypothetical protein
MNLFKKGNRRSMLNLESVEPVFLAPGATDIRKYRVVKNSKLPEVHNLSPDR